MKQIFLFLFLICNLVLAAQSLKGKKILLYTKNGAGYVHENIPYALKCFDSLSRMYQFTLISSQDSAYFTDNNLKSIDLIVFASTNNDVFASDAHKLAFRKYIESGGSFFGIHSAIGTERKWTWMKQMMGGSFAWHPKFQPFKLLKLNAGHFTNRHLASEWIKKDECYFNKELYPGYTTTLVVDLQSLKLDSTETIKYTQFRNGFDRYMPISWEQNFDGGRIFMTTLGHDKTDYSEKNFTTYLVDCMNYLLKDYKPKDLSKAYATRFDQVVNFLK